MSSGSVSIYRHTARPRHCLLERPVLQSRWPDLLFRPLVRPSTKASSRFAPDGTLDRTVGLPVENATSVIFGGLHLDIAYVTSMARVVKRVRQRERAGGCSWSTGSASAAFRSRASGVDVELGESDLELTSLSRGFRNRDEGDFGLTGGGFACQYGASRKTWTAAGQSAWSYCEWS